jgi:hypothetical protein
LGLGVVSWRGERAGQVCYLRRGATGPAGVRNWPTMWQAPCLARCGPVRTGRPLAGEGGEEGRGLPLAFGSISGSRAVRCGVGLRGEAARRVGLRGVAARQVEGWRGSGGAVG